MQHLIQKQVLDIRLLGSQEPRKRQQAIQSLYWERIVPALDRQLSHLIPADRVLRLDQLQLDLGQVAFDDLEKSVVVALKKAIKEQLQQMGNAVSHSPQNSALRPSEKTGVHLEALTYFLSFGIYPWWFSAAQTLSPDELLQKVISKNTGELIQFLQSGKVASQVLQKRLVQQFSLEQLEKLTSTAFAKAVAPLRELINFFQQLKKAKQQYQTALSSKLSVKLIQVLQTKESQLTKQILAKSLVAKRQPNAESILLQFINIIAAALKITTVQTVEAVQIILATNEDSNISSISNVFDKIAKSINAPAKKQIKSLAQQSKIELTDSKKIREKNLLSTPGNTKPFTKIQDLNIQEKINPKHTVTTSEKEVPQPKEKQVAPNNPDLQKYEELSKSKDKAYMVAKIEPEDAVSKPANIDVDTSSKGVKENNEKSSSSILSKNTSTAENISSKKMLAKKTADTSEVVSDSENQIAELPEQTAFIQKQLAAALEEGIYIDYAGLVLIAPFLPTFFKKLGLTEKQEFVSTSARERATLLLHFLATGITEVNEQHLLFAKILTGFPLEESLADHIVLTAIEQKETASLLNSVIEHWNALGKSGIDALRETFLMREGKILEQDGKYKLIVARKTVDLLLDKISWSYVMIKLPWMQQQLNVVW